MLCVHTKGLSVCSGHCMWNCVFGLFVVSGISVSKYCKNLQNLHAGVFFLNDLFSDPVFVYSCGLYVSFLSFKYISSTKRLSRRIKRAKASFLTHYVPGTD